MDIGITDNGIKQDHKGVIANIIKKQNSSNSTMDLGLFCFVIGYAEGLKHSVVRGFP